MPPCASRLLISLPGVRREVPEEVAGVFVRPEEFFDPLAQRGIASAGFVKPGSALPNGQTPGRAKDGRFVLRWMVHGPGTLFLQPEEQIPLGRRIGDAVVDNGAGIITPRRGGEIGVGLQRPTGRRWRPRDDGLVADERDGQQRRAGSLHCIERPKTTVKRITATRR